MDYLKYISYFVGFVAIIGVVAFLIKTLTPNNWDNLKGG